MNAVSMNNLWTYLQGLALTADNWDWLAAKTSEMSVKKKTVATPKVKTKKYKMSPTVKELMGSVRIDPKHIEEDERMKYILCN